MLELSPFKLSMFRQCRRKYKLHYVDGLSEQYKKPRPYLTMGDHVHWVLKTFLSPQTPPDKRTMEHLESLLRKRWLVNRTGFDSREIERDWGEKALRQLRNFYSTQDAHVVPKMIEAIHKAPLTPELRLMGKIDRVDESDGGLVVTDYKTGKRPMVPNLLQLRTYAIILKRKFRQPVVRAYYLYLESSETEEILPEEDELAEAEEELIAYREEILAERDFLPIPGRLCPFCDFQELCPEGIAYGGPTVSSEELDE